MNVTKQMYKYYKQTQCSHMIAALADGRYTEELKDRDDDGIIDALDILGDIFDEEGQEDQAAKYFKDIGNMVEREFVKDFNNPLYKDNMEFKIEGQTLRPDLIYINDVLKTIDVIEIKSSTNNNLYKADGYSFNSTKLKHIYDCEFQYHMLKKKFPDYTITMNLGLINKVSWPTVRFDVVNVTEYMEDVATFNHWVNSIKEVLENKMEAYNMDASKSKCCFNIECGKCGFNEDKIYDNFDTVEINKLLEQYPVKLAMIDFEAINNPLPTEPYYAPYDKVVVQLSAHIMEGDKVVEHFEYITKNTSKEELSIIYNKLVEIKNRGYKMVAYYKPYETGCFKKMSEILDREELLGYELLDLYDFFKKQSKTKLALVSKEEFGMSASIKKTIQYAYGPIENNPYKNGKLPVNNGFQAMALLYYYVLEGTHQEHLKDLYAYCEQDTLTMVDIYNQIRKEA